MAHKSRKKIRINQEEYHTPNKYDLGLVFHTALQKPKYLNYLPVK